MLSRYAWRSANRIVTWTEEIRNQQNVNLPEDLHTPSLPCPCQVPLLALPPGQRLCLSIIAYFTSCFQEVCDLRHRHEVSHMWLACGCCSPVNFKFPILQYLLQLLFPQNLLLWKQKSWFNAGAPPCSSFTLWQGKQRHVSPGVQAQSQQGVQPWSQWGVRANKSWCCC